MPKAVITEEQRKGERFPLETAPPDGYVVIRKMTFSEDLKVRGMSMRMHMQQEELRRARKEAKERGLDETEIEIEMSIDVDAVLAFQFRNMILDHNLEDENGRKLNFANRADFAKLDTEVGAEIEKIINNLNPKRESKEEEEAERAEGGTPLSTASGRQ